MNIFEARLRHEAITRNLGLTEDEINETWDLMLEVQGIEYPPGPTPEQELVLIKLGKIVSRRMGV